MYHSPHEAEIPKDRSKMFLIYGRTSSHHVSDDVLWTVGDWTSVSKILLALVPINSKNMQYNPAEGNRDFSAGFQFEKHLLTCVPGCLPPPGLCSCANTCPNRGLSLACLCSWTALNRLRLSTQPSFRLLLMSCRTDAAIASISASLQPRRRKGKWLGTFWGTDVVEQLTAKVQSIRSRSRPILWRTRPRVVQYVELQGWYTYRILGGQFEQFYSHNLNLELEFKTQCPIFISLNSKCGFP